MKRLLALLLISGTALGQSAGRWDTNAWTAATNVPIGAQAPVFTVPYATVTICTDGGCATPVNVYDDRGLTQLLTQPLQADAQGRFGFWATPGTYWQTVCSPAEDCQAGWITVGSASDTSGPVVEVNSTPISPSSPANFVNTSSVTWAFTGGQILATAAGGGTSNCGPLSNDATSTNCGNGNFASFTPASGGSVAQAFGLDNMAVANSGASFLVAVGSNNVTVTDGKPALDIIGIGDSSAFGITSPATSNSNNIIGIGEAAAYHVCGNTIIGIGEAAAENIACPTDTNDIIALGDGAADGYTGSVTPYAGSWNNLIALGDGAGSFWAAGTQDVVAIGDGAGSVNALDIFTGGPVYSPTALVAVGVGAGVRYGGSYMVAVGAAGGDFLTGSADIVAIGDGSGYGPHTSIGGAHFRVPTAVSHDLITMGDFAGWCGAGNENIGIGDRVFYATSPVGTNDCYGLTGTDNIGIGDHALPAVTSGTHNVAIGYYAGGNGWIAPAGTTGALPTIANSNQTGSQNTWIGDNSGPNTPTQLSNTIALGYNAQVSASNQAVIGNSSITQTTTFGVSAPGTIYSAAGTALPTCAVGNKGAQAVVSDATAPTYMGAYTSGGAITAAVLCSFNGTTYSWLTH